MKRIIIIGSSIAGVSMANFLAGHCEIEVYEQKQRKDIGKKVCANVVTINFFKYARILKLNPEKYVTSKFNKAVGISENQIAEFKTNEFRIDREKLIEDLIKKAEKRGVRFNFEANFKEFKEEKGRFIVRIDDKIEICDILIGADGPLSKVAKQAGLWKDRKLLLMMQSEIPLKKLNIEEDSYCVYLGREKFGYYSYIIPSGKKAIIGMGDKAEDAKKKYEKFLGILNVKNIKKSGALIPEPQVIPQKKNLFVIGDAGCHVKFSGGGIIPAIMAAEAVSEIIIKRDYTKLKILDRRTYTNNLAAKIIWKFKEKDFDHLLNVLKDRKFDNLLEKRDEFSKKDYISFMDIRLMRYLLKLF